MSIYSNRGYVHVYVSPNGTGSGSSADDPAYFKDIFAKLTSNLDKSSVTVFCLPGTYDFGDTSYNMFGHIVIKASDSSNKPVFTRSTQVAVNKYLFTVYNVGSFLSFYNIIFDKWSAGRGDTDTDIPACAEAYGGGEVRILGCEIRATKFSGAISGVQCFYASNKESQIAILANLSTSDPTLLFDAPNSTDPGSSSYNCYVCHCNNGGYITGFTSATLYVEIKAGALGSSLIVFDGLKKTEYGSSIFDITFDSCYKLIIADFATSIFINLKQQGYNSDGTVNNTAVGGTDYKVYNTLFALAYSANCRITITLKSDVFCEKYFFLAGQASGKVYLNAANAVNINSSAAGNSLSDNAAIYLNTSALYCLISENVSVNNVNNLKFDYGVLTVTGSGISMIKSTTTGTSLTISGRSAAVYVKSSIIRVYYAELVGAVNGIHLQNTNCDATLYSVAINNNTTGINIENSSKVTTSNVTFSGNTNNYSSNANVSAATAKVRTT